MELCVSYVHTYLLSQLVGLTADVLQLVLLARQPILIILPPLLQVVDLEFGLPRLAREAGQHRGKDEQVQIERESSITYIHAYMRHTPLSRHRFCSKKYIDSIRSLIIWLLKGQGPPATAASERMKPKQHAR